MLEFARSSRLLGARLASLVCIGTGFWLAGCETRLSRYSDEEREERNIAVNAEQTRVAMRAMVEPMTGLVIESADQIIAQADDPAIQRAALDWKINATAALRESIYLPSPRFAVIDTWILTYQMVDYFKDGRGRERFGEYADIALETSRKLEDYMGQLVSSMVLDGDVTRARAYVRGWAQKYPIQYSIANRFSILNNATREELPDSFSTMEIAGKLTTMLDDLNRRLGMYSSQLLEAARWEAERFAMDMNEEYGLTEIRHTADEATAAITQTSAAISQTTPAIQETGEAVKRTAVVAEKLPDLLTTERTEILGALKDELGQTRTFVQGEREAILQHITAERKVALDEFQQIIADEREIFTSDLEMIGFRLVDHAAWRIIQILALVWLGLLALLVIASHLFRRREA